VLALRAAGFLFGQVFRQNLIVAGTNLKRFGLRRNFNARRSPIGDLRAFMERS
jgi:hypothetical protein